jgi:hypothetical protein
MYEKVTARSKFDVTTRRKSGSHVCWQLLPMFRPCRTSDKSIEDRLPTRKQ